MIEYLLTRNALASASHPHRRSVFPKQIISNQDNHISTSADHAHLHAQGDVTILVIWVHCWIICLEHGVKIHLPQIEIDEERFRDTPQVNIDVEKRSSRAGDQSILSRGDNLWYPYVECENGIDVPLIAWLDIYSSCSEVQVGVFNMSVSNERVSLKSQSALFLTYV